MISALLLTMALAPTSLKDLQPLVGSWTGTSKGASGIAKVTKTFAPALDGKYIRFDTEARFPAKGKASKGEVHRDFGIFSYDSGRKALILREFHVEGFVNTYAQETADALTFSTESIENIPVGFRARVRIKLISKNELEEEFSLAEPGKNFEVYSLSRLTRR